MATKHYIGDYSIEKNGKTVKKGQMQFARVNVTDEHDEDEAFEAAQRDYPGVVLSRNTFREVLAVGPMTTNPVVDDKGNTIATVTNRPPVIIPPPTQVVVPAGVPQAAPQPTGLVDAAGNAIAESETEPQAEPNPAEQQ